MLVCTCPRQKTTCQQTLKHIWYFIFQTDACSPSWWTSLICVPGLNIWPCCRNSSIYIFMQFGFMVENLSSVTSLFFQINCLRLFLIFLWKYVVLTAFFCYILFWWLHVHLRCFFSLNLWRSGDSGCRVTRFLCHPSGGMNGRDDRWAKCAPNPAHSTLLWPRRMHRKRHRINSSRMARRMQLQTASY